jgi:hypothetical protein
MKRLIFFTLALLVGCNGMGSGGNRFLPTGPASGIGGTAADSASGVGAKGVENARRRKMKVKLTLTVPRRHRGERADARHPSTISPSTQSVGIGVNGAAAQIFNTTPTSPGCSIGPSGTTCAFTISASAGSDTLTVSTFSATSGGGIALDHGSAIVDIVKGQLNNPQITLGPVVSTTVDNGMGSLRYAIGTANAGDTIMFLLPAGSTISVASPLTISTNVNISGQGVTTSTRGRSGRLGSNATFSGITVSGGNNHQVFIINSGVTVTISGLIVTAGQASVAHQPGGAISNQGTLTLLNDAVTDSTSLVTNVRNIPVRPSGHPAPSGHLPLRPAPPMHPRMHPHACTVSEQYGGALYNNGVLTITGTTFDSNSVSDNCAGQGEGGAIYNDTNGSMTVTNSTFSNNAGGYGGAIYNDGSSGQATFTSDAFTGNQGCTSANGCATSGCSLPNSCTTYAYGYGAAIYDGGGPGVSIATSTFTNNVAGGKTPSSEGYGGALYLATGSPIVTGSTFTGNLAGGGTSNCSYGYGGGIYESASNTLELDNDIFTSNVASGDEDGYGGAVYNNSQPDHGSGNTFTSNVAVASGSLCEQYPDAYGAALYAYYGISMSGSTFSTNSATSAYEIDGGTIYTDKPSTLSGNTFTGNTAATTSLTGADGYIYGGIIENDGTLKLINNTFSSNAANAGGAYGEYVYGGVIDDVGGLYSSQNTFASNTSSTTYPDDGYVEGGVIYAEHCCSGSALLSSSGDTFKSNAPTSSYAIYGGAIYTDEYSQLSVTSDAFTSNLSSALYVDGGAIYAYGTGPNSISNSTFTGNVAGTGSQQGWSGAVEADYYSTTNAFTISGSTFSGNSATVGGGAIGDYSHGPASLTIDNSMFTGNAVTNGLSYYGGGALDTEGNVSTIVMNSTFAGNAVTPSQIGSGGGAIFNYNGLLMFGSTLSGNSVLGSVPGTGGGGVYNYEAAAMENDTIAGNGSNEDGGGIENGANYPVTIANATIYQNKASGNGGNIENPYGLLLANTIVAGGTAGGIGPDIDNSGGTLSSADYNLVQTPIAGTPMATPNPDHDVLGMDPKLLTLANNGGPTLTNADQATSPGAAYIPYVAGKCGVVTLAIDQRGFTRGTGGKCDIGAFELNGIASAIREHIPTLHAGHRHQRVRIPVKPKHNPLAIHRSSNGAK